MTDAFGGARIQVKPPERGVFPLDHDGECKALMTSFLGCLEDNKHDHFPCKDFSKAYLQCRMDKNLMAKENMSNLGFDDHGEYIRVERATDTDRENNGFVAGLGVKPGRKWWHK
jgi:cytochrome c oxidase assembly protein subunit 19